MFTPAKILKTWKRVNDRFGLAEDDPKARGKEKEKKQSSKAKQAEKEDLRVNKRLTELRTLGKGDLSEPRAAKRFLKSRDKTAKAMKKYCKLLKSNDLRDSVQDLSKFRKAVKQLVVVVELLDARPYADEDEGGETDLTALDKVDTSALDKAMEDPNFGEYSEEELDAPEEEVEEGKEETKVETQTKEGLPRPIDQDAAEFTARLKALMPSIQKAQVEKSPAADEIRLRVSEANVFARKKDFAQGNLLLDKVEALLKSSAGQSPKVQSGAAEFTARLKALMPEIQKAQAAKSQTGNEIKLRVSEANVFARKNDFFQANALLDKVEAMLKSSGGGDSTTQPRDPAAEFKARLAEWTPAIKAAMAAKGPRAADIAKLLAQATALSKPGGDSALALAKLTECHKLAGMDAPPTQGESGKPAALAKWKAAREGAIAQLRALAAELTETGLPEVPKALILINSIVKNLTPEPAERNQVDELERYLSGDDVVADACLAFDLSGPLLSALADLKQQMPAK